MTKYFLLQDLNKYIIICAVIEFIVGKLKMN